MIISTLYKNWFSTLAITAWLTGSVVAQPSLPYTPISLADLGNFQPPKSTTWQIVGKVSANRQLENNLTVSPGTGILVVHPLVTNRANLFTKLEHGDIDLELDFLMPKGSNSGVYLQGRYEVQLVDSWLKDTLTNSDCGGLYQRYNDNTRQIFEGHAPMLNAAKAPGLWQHLSIRFRAPRFDHNGKKIANARFEEVRLNGIQIHVNKEVTGPTMSAAFPDEQPSGPIMLQGDHGPVAFRNIAYKAYTSGEIRLSNMQFRGYKGLYKTVEALAEQTPVKTGTTDTLSWRLGDRKAQLAIEGDMEVPRAGKYLFRFISGGAGWLFIDNQQVIDTKGNRDFERSFYASRELTAGKHRFQVYYGNSDESLVWHYEGPGIPWTVLTTPSSHRRTKAPEPLAIDVVKTPVIQRGFMLHQGKVNPYAVSVGIPEKLNYAYDLITSSPLSVWHGRFVDVSNMWVERGEKQLEIPLGAALDLTNRLSIMQLPEANAPWPDSLIIDDSPYTKQGYRLLPTGLPVFYYTYGAATVEDYLHPTTDKKGLTRDLTLTLSQPATNLYCLLATGNIIEKQADGSYTVDDKRYYLEAVRGGSQPPVIRQVKGQYELILPLAAAAGKTTVTYTMIW